MSEGTTKHRVDSSPEYAKQAIQKSLKRLGLAYVDLYYCHRLDKVTPIGMWIARNVRLASNVDHASRLVLTYV